MKGFASALILSSPAENLTLKSRNMQEIKQNMENFKGKKSWKKVFKMDQTFQMITGLIGKIDEVTKSFSVSSIQVNDKVLLFTCLASISDCHSKGHEERDEGRGTMCFAGAYLINEADAEFGEREEGDGEDEGRKEEEG